MGSKQTMRLPIVDFHAHAFPDELAARAIGKLENTGGAKAFLDGRVASVLSSMDDVGIERSVLCSIATKPEQFDPILNWSLQIASPRIVPLASIHPRGDDPIGQARRVAEAGLVGIKLHPYYQHFDIDAEELFPLYRVLEELGLLIVCHTGFDYAFSRERKADPVRLLRVLDRVPDLRFVASHMGAWDDWEEVERHILGRPITFDVSLSLDLLGRTRAREMILAHPPDRVLFGSDSPWGSQAGTLQALRSLNLGEAREQAILWKNAQALLGMAATDSHQ
jgi:predicted TIM-barrel fold metal-dependent hydrolase